MASLNDVFTEPERSNWLKAWLAIDIAKSGLEQFAENEAKTLHGNIYNVIWSSVQAPVVCIGCHTANLLKCPSPGICKKRGAHSKCKSMHDTALKQPRPCPSNVCDKIFVAIEKEHKFSIPSWKNTIANHWAKSPWQIAKAYFPPDGYTEKSSAQDTDFNGIISFMMNCKHFDNRFSFPIALGKTHPPCLLTRARDICKSVRHSSMCKVPDADLQEIFLTLTSLLTDPTCLANDVAAQDAVRKLAKLQTDVLKLTTQEIVELLEAAQDKLKKVENITGTFDEMRIYIENCRKDLSAYNDKCKKELDEHTGKCKEQLEEHRRKTTETEYDQSCKDFRRRLIAHYDDTSSTVPLSNLDQSLDKRIADLYATPKIHRIEIGKDGKRVKQEQVLTYKQIFYTDCMFKSNRRIYIQGEPGSGKSTFSAKLVHDWSDGSQVSSASPSATTAFNDGITMHKFKFLFFIKLRESKGQTDVTQMIKKQLIDTTFSEDERADVYKLLLQIMNTENFLVVREGLDEWVSPDGSYLAEPSMAGFQNSTCTVLTTSRPWKLSDERIKNSQIDRLLEIEGISNPYAFSKNILRCIIDHTKDLEETAIKFKSFVKVCALKSLSSSPMLYTLVICTWLDTNEEEEHLKGSSLCALYTTLLESLCKKANSTTGYFNDSNPPPVQCFYRTSYLQPNIEHLDKLAQVACKLIFSSERESSIVFSDMTLSNYFSPDEFTVRKTFALKAGILTQRKDKSRTGSSNSFVHKTMQELLAAYHIACNPCVIDDVIFRYLERSKTSYLEISQVFIFLCGMNISAANKLSALMNQCEVTDCSDYDFEDCVDMNWHECWHRSDPCEFQRIIESGIREAVANNQDGIQLKLSHFYIDERNMRDLNYIWSTNTSNVQVLYVNINLLSSPAHGEPTSHFELKLSSCHTLQQLYLSGSDICLGGLDYGDSDDDESDEDQDREDNKEDKYGQSSSDDDDYEERLRRKRELFGRTQRSRLDDIEREEMELISKKKHTSEFPIWIDQNSSDSPSAPPCILYLSGRDICLRDTSEFPIWIDQNSSDSPSVPPCIKHICLIEVRLSSNRLRSLLLLNLNHDVQVALEHCDITTSCVESSDICTTATIRTVLNVNNELQIGYLINDSPGLWGALNGLNIKSLRLEDDDEDFRFDVNNKELLSQFLSSLTHLEALSIGRNNDMPSLCKALHGMNINDLNLRLSDGFGDLTVNQEESLSQCLSSLTHLETLSISVRKDSPSLWEALRGLNIKSLTLDEKLNGLKVNHVESLSQCLSSLKQLETLRIHVNTYHSGLFEVLEALCGLNIKSLDIEIRCLRLNHVGSSSQSLSSLTKLETLSISVNEPKPVLWALRGLNIKSLSLSGRWEGSIVNHVESLSQCLSSLTQLETLSIRLLKDSSGLCEALRGLNIKSLSLCDTLIVSTLTHVESLSQCISTLTQLETLSISVNEDSPGMWEALRGLNIKSLSLVDEWTGLRVNHVESLSQSLSSLTQLETFTICMDTYIDVQLPQSLKYFNIYCRALRPSELSDLLNRMCVCTEKVESRLEFGCTFQLNYTPLEEYIDIQVKLKKLKNVIVKGFRIYERTLGSHMWSVRDIGGVDEDDPYDGNKKLTSFIDMDRTMNRISMRLQIIPVSI